MNQLLISLLLVVVAAYLYDISDHYFKKVSTNQIRKDLLQVLLFHYNILYNKENL